MNDTTASPPEPQRDGSRRLIVLAAAAVVAAGLYYARPVLGPLLIALLIGVLTAPLVLWLGRRGAPKWLAVAAGLLLDLVVLAALGLVFGVAVAELSAEQERYVRRFTEVLTAWTAWLQAHGVPLSIESFETLVEPQALVRTAADVLRRLWSTLSQLLLVLLLVAFMLVELQSAPGKLEQAMASREDLDAVYAVLVDIKRFFRVKATTSAVTGALAGALCASLSVELPVLWGLTAFLLNFIPMIGSLLAAVPPIVLAALFLGPGSAVAVAAGYFAINMLIGNIIEPRVMGRALGLSPFVVLVSLLVWGSLLGPAGALVSPALTVLLKAWLAHTRDFAWVATILGPHAAADTRA